MLDLDGCRNPETGELAREAQEIIEQFSDTYIEISPSGRGLHILCFGDPIPQKTKAYMTWTFSGPKTGEKCEVEMWSHTQYIALTGVPLS